MLIKEELASSATKIRVEYTSPNKCPICGKAIEPKKLASHIDQDQRLSVMFLCPGCNCSFLSVYNNPHKTTNTALNTTFDLYSSAPLEIEDIHFPKEIDSISQNFSKIYNQAHKAEEYKLNEIAGIGYRKALEFLIKDFCILLHPEEEQDIKKKLLSKCINEYLTEYKHLQNVSTVAYWLGNDETHYFKEFTSNDINDLKNYLEAVILYIQLEAKNGSAKEIIQKRYSQKNQ